MPRQSVSRSLRSVPPVVPSPVPDPASSAPSSNGNNGGLKFTLVGMDTVPKFVPGGQPQDPKYKAIEEALKALPPNQAICIPVPMDQTHAKFGSNVLSSIRRRIPETRSRAIAPVDGDTAFPKGRLYLWMGDKTEVEARRKKTAERLASAPKGGSR